jgi:hypothetical protein
VDDFETCIQVMTVLQVGLDSEKLNIFTKQGSQKFESTKVKGPALALTWYKVLLSLEHIYTAN